MKILLVWSGLVQGERQKLSQEIEFTSDPLHLLIIQTTSFWKDCELIPLKSVLSEDVTDEELIGRQKNRSVSNRKLWHPSDGSRIQHILSERSESIKSLDPKQRWLSWAKRRDYTSPICFCFSPYTGIAVPAAFLAT